MSRTYLSILSFRVEPVLERGVEERERSFVPLLRLLEGSCLLVGKFTASGSGVGPVLGG